MGREFPKCSSIYGRLVLLEDVQDLAGYIRPSEGGRTWIVASSECIEDVAVDAEVVGVLVHTSLGRKAFEWCRTYRLAGGKAPMLVVLSRCSELDRVIGEQFGATRVRSMTADPSLIFDELSELVHVEEALTQYRRSSPSSYSGRFRSTTS